MRYSVLGPVEVRSDGGELLLPKGRNQRLLLATLVSHAPRVVSVDRLVDALWGDRPPADPSAALHTQVARLRALLRAGGDGAQPIEREPYGYRLAAGPNDIDTTRFAALIATAGESPTPDDALACIDEALALWRGDPYEEFVAGRAFLAEIARLQELRTGALERRTELLLALGRTADALTTIEPVVLAAPLRERPVALAMEALYRAGRQSEALDAFQRHRRRLSEDLGLEPSPSLRQLELEILRHGRSLGIAAPTPPLEPGRPPAGAPRGPLLRVAFVARPGDRRIAYAESGEGAPLLMLPAWVSNLSAIGSGSDPRAALLAAVADRCRLILHDRMGMGLSTRTALGAASSMVTAAAADAALDAGIDEALAVLDAAGIERTSLLALSQAGPTALALAARHPARVARLVLVGTYASGPAAFPRAEVRASVLALIRAHWGLGSRMIADLILPDADAAEVELFARVQRESATPEQAARALEALYAADVSDLLPAVHQPARVIHYERDTAIPFSAGQELAARLPTAELIALPGRAHLPRGPDADRVAALVAEFVGER